MAATAERISSLSERQGTIYQFIRGKILGRGYGPTVREIGAEFGIKSPNGVMCHLKALQKKGVISREPNQSRAISLLAETRPEPAPPTLPPDWMILASVHYALGRLGFSVYPLATWLVDHWPHLSAELRARISHEIEREWHSAKPLALGSAEDIEQWQRLRDLWSA